MFSLSRFTVPIAYKWLVTIAVSLGMFMSLMDMTIVNVAIPQMQSIFGATIHDVQWVVTIYMLTQAAVIPTAPYLSAKFGEKRAYVWTLIALTAMYFVPKKSKDREKQPEQIPQLEEASLS